MLQIDPVGLMALAATASAMVLLPKIGQSRHRAHQLRNCVALLRAHNDALEAFMADPAAPPRLRRLLLDMSDSFDEDSRVVGLAQLIMTAARTSEPRLRKGMPRDLTELAKSNPDLAGVFSLAVTNGALAAFLRVPETARHWDDLVAAITTLGSATTVRVVESVPTTPRPLDLDLAFAA